MRQLLCRQYLADAAIGAGTLCGLMVGGLGFNLAMAWSIAGFIAALGLSLLPFRRLQRLPPEEAAPHLIRGWHWQVVTAGSMSFWISVQYGGRPIDTAWAHSIGYHLQPLGLIGGLMAQGLWLLSWPATDPRHGKERWLGWLQLVMASVIGVETIATWLAE